MVNLQNAIYPSGASTEQSTQYPANLLWTSLVQMSSTNPLITEAIPKLIRKIGIPVGTGVLFNTLFQVVDTFFAGTISTEALAALALSFPIFFGVIGIASGFATGTSALIGNALGAGKQDEAEHIALQGLLLTIILALLMMTLGLLTAPFLFGLLGASGDYLDTNMSYIKPIFYGTLFFNLVFMFNASLTAQGNTRPFRNFLMFGFFLNILLDPWFISGGFGLPAMGIAGVGLATSLIQAIGAVYLGFTALRTPLFELKDWGLLRPDMNKIGQIIQQGLPPALDLSTVSLGGFIVTYFISQFGTDAVAAYGIASRIDRLVWLPLVGLDVATLSLVAQNNGAKRYDRVWQTIVKAVRYGILLMVVLGILVFIFASQLMTFFSIKPDIIAVGVHIIRISAVSYLALPFSFIGFAALRGVKRPILPMLMSITRMIILPAIVIYILLTFFNVGLTGIWWTITGINILIATIAWWVMAMLIKPKTYL